MAATYTLPNVDGQISSSLLPLIMALQAGQAGNWKRERKIIQNQRKAEAKRNQREAANQEAQAAQLREQQATEARNKAVQTGLQAQSGGAAPISLAGVRSAAGVTPSVSRGGPTSFLSPYSTTPANTVPQQAAPRVLLPAASPSALTRPFNYVPDLSKLTFGGV